MLTLLLEACRLSVVVAHALFGSHMKNTGTSLSDIAAVHNTETETKKNKQKQMIDPLVTSFVKN